MRIDRLRGVLLPFVACTAMCAVWIAPGAAGPRAPRPAHTADVALAPALPEPTAERLVAPPPPPAATQAPVEADLDEPDSLDDAVVSWLHERVRRGHAR